MNPSTRNDAIVVVDVESTCWKGESPAGEHSEIVEIGVCLLDLTTFERSAKRSILVRPTRSKVSAFCIKKFVLRGSASSIAVIHTRILRATPFATTDKHPA